MKTSIYSIAFVLVLIGSIHHVLGQNGPNADEYLRLAAEYRTNQEPDSAILYYEKASVEFQKMGNAEAFVNACNQIGIILTRQDKYAEAKTYLEQALSTGLSSLDTNSLVMATTYISLGVNFAAEENYTQSLLYHNKALSIRLKLLGEYSADAATSYGNIGNVYLRSKDYDNSIDAHLKAMVIREKIFGETGIEVIQSYTNLGTAYKEKKDYPTSLFYFEKALQNKILQLGEGHKDVSRFYKNVSDVYYLLDNNTQGDFYRIRSESILKN